MCQADSCNVNSTTTDGSETLDRLKSVPTGVFFFLSPESELCSVQAQTILHTLIHITSSCFCAHVSIHFSVTDAERVDLYAGKEFQVSLRKSRWHIINKQDLLTYFTLVHFICGGKKYNQGKLYGSDLRLCTKTFVPKIWFYHLRSKHFSLYSINMYSIKSNI